MGKKNFFRPARRLRGNPNGPEIKRALYCTKVVAIDAGCRGESTAVVYEGLRCSGMS